MMKQFIKVFHLRVGDSSKSRSVVSLAASPQLPKPSRRCNSIDISLH